MYAESVADKWQNLTNDDVQKVLIASLGFTPTGEAYYETKFQSLKVRNNAAGVPIALRLVQIQTFSSGPLELNIEASRITYPPTTIRFAECGGSWSKRSQQVALNPKDTQAIAKVYTGEAAQIVISLQLMYRHSESPQITLGVGNLLVRPALGVGPAVEGEGAEDCADGTAAQPVMKFRNLYSHG